MNKLTRISATVASSLALVAGFSGMASAASPSNTIKHTGQHSHNLIANVDFNATSVDNHTHVAAEVHNDQDVSSGDVNANGNNNVKNVWTGDAKATNTVSGSVSVDNSSATSAALSSPSGDSNTSGDNTIQGTGKDSTNTEINANVNLTKVDNDTSVRMESHSDQDVSSGDVNANYNNNVKNVSTGDATATNSSTFTVDVTN